MSVRREQMQHADQQFGQGNLSSLSQYTSPERTVSSPNSSVTSSLRLWRKKDANDKKHLVDNIAPSTGSEAHVARVAPQSHYQKFISNDVCRFSNSFSKDYSPIYKQPNPPTPVKYSEIVEPPPNQKLDQLSPPTLKQKDKECIEMANNPQLAMKSFPDHYSLKQHYPDPSLKQQYPDNLNRSFMEHLKQSYVDPSLKFPTYPENLKQPYHEPMKHPFSEQLKETYNDPNIHSQFISKDPQLYPYVTKDPQLQQYISKYNIPYSRPYSMEQNNYLAHLNKIHPRMAQSIISDQHLREAAQVPVYHNVDQGRAYGPVQRMFNQPPSIGSNSYPSHVNRNIPQPPYNYPQPYNMNVKQNPDPYRIPYQPGIPKYITPSEQPMRNCSPRRTYSDNVPMQMNYSSVPPKMSGGMYPPCNQLEYAQHYQHRRDQVPEYFAPMGYKQSYLNQNSLAPDINSDGSQNPKSNALKQFLETWVDEEIVGLPDVVVSNNVEQEKYIAKSCKRDDQNEPPLYILDTTEIPSESLPQYMHLQQFEKLPENIKGYYQINKEALGSLSLNEFERNLMEFKQNLQQDGQRSTEMMEGKPMEKIIHHAEPEPFGSMMVDSSREKSAQGSISESSPCQKASNGVKSPGSHVDDITLETNSNNPACMFSGSSKFQQQDVRNNSQESTNMSPDNSDDISSTDRICSNSSIVPNNSEEKCSKASEKTDKESVDIKNDTDLPVCLAKEIITEDRSLYNSQTPSVIVSTFTDSKKKENPVTELTKSREEILEVDCEFKKHDAPVGQDHPDEVKNNDEVKIKVEPFSLDESNKGNPFSSPAEIKCEKENECIASLEKNENKNQEDIKSNDETEIKDAPVVATGDVGVKITIEEKENSLDINNTVEEPQTLETPANKSTLEDEKILHDDGDKTLEKEKSSCPEDSAEDMDNVEVVSEKEKDSKEKNVDQSSKYDSEENVSILKQLEEWIESGNDDIVKETLPTEKIVEEKENEECSLTLSKEDSDKDVTKSCPEITLSSPENEYRNAYKIEENNVLLQIGEDFLEILVSERDGRKVITVKSLTDAIVNSEPSLDKNHTINEGNVPTSDCFVDNENKDLSEIIKNSDEVINFSKEKQDVTCVLEEIQNDNYLNTTSESTVEDISKQKEEFVSEQQNDDKLSKEIELEEINHQNENEINDESSEINEKQECSTESSVQVVEETVSNTEDTNLNNSPTILGNCVEQIDLPVGEEDTIETQDTSEAKYIVINDEESFEIDTIESQDTSEAKSVVKSNESMLKIDTSGTEDTSEAKSLVRNSEKALKIDTIETQDISEAKSLVKNNEKLVKIDTIETPEISEAKSLVKSNEKLVKIDTIETPEISEAKSLVKSNEQPFKIDTIETPDISEAKFLVKSNEKTPKIDTIVTQDTSEAKSLVKNDEEPFKVNDTSPGVIVNKTGVVDSSKVLDEEKEDGMKTTFRIAALENDKNDSRSVKNSLKIVLKKCKIDSVEKISSGTVQVQKTKAARKAFEDSPEKKRTLKEKHHIHRREKLDDKSTKNTSNEDQKKKTKHIHKKEHISKSKEEKHKEKICTENDKSESNKKNNVSKIDRPKESTVNLSKNSTKEKLVVVSPDCGKETSTKSTETNIKPVDINIFQFERHNFPKKSPIIKPPRRSFNKSLSQDILTHENSKKKEEVDMEVIHKEIIIENNFEFEKKTTPVSTTKEDTQKTVQEHRVTSSTSLDLEKHEEDDYEGKSDGGSNKRRLSLEEYNRRKRRRLEMNVSKPNLSPKHADSASITTETGTLTDNLLINISCRKFKEDNHVLEDLGVGKIDRLQDKEFVAPVSSTETEEIRECSNNWSQNIYSQNKWIQNFRPVKTFEPTNTEMVREYEMLMKRFLKQEQLTVEELKKVKQIIRYKRWLQSKEKDEAGESNKPGNLLLDINSNENTSFIDCDQRKSKEFDNANQKSTDVTDKRRIRKRFRNLYTEDDSDESNTCSKLKKSTVENNDYSVHQSDSIKLVFKRTTQLQPIVWLERCNALDQLAKNYS